MKTKSLNLKMLTAGLVLLSLLFVAGCGDELSDVLDERQTELESRYLLDRASRIDKDTDLNITVPEVYSRPSRILETSEGFKVFYFTRNRSPKALSDLIKAQMGINTITDFAGTNQLIISCSTHEEAEEVLQFIQRIDVAAIQVKIEVMVIENYADLTMDRETRVQVGEFLGMRRDELVITGPDNGWGLFPGAALREGRRGEYGMSVGYKSSDIRFLIDLLVSRGYLKVQMNPVVRTVANRPATIVARDRVPITKIVTGRDISPYNITEYTWVEDSLTVTPSVYADGTIGLNTKVRFGSKNTPEGVVQLRIITERGIDLGETRVPLGNSLVVGGFRKSEKYSVIRGFPLLKDLPIIGPVFSSKDFEERAKEVTFIITPSIATDGIEYSEMVDKINELHRDHYKDDTIADRVTGVATDPFGHGHYADRVEQMAATEKLERLRAEVEAAESEREARQAQERLEEYEAVLISEAEAARESRQLAQQYARKLREAQEAKEKLEKAQEDHTEQAQATIEQAQAQYDARVKEVAEIKEKIEASSKKVSESEQLIKEMQQRLEQMREQQAELEKQAKELEERRIEAREAAEAAREERQRREAEEQARLEAQREAERRAQEQAEAEARAKAEAEAKAQAEAEARAKEQESEEVDEEIEPEEDE